MSDPLTRSLDLVLRAQKGDRAALDALVARYRDRVLRIVRARLGAKLRERVDSEDILQETFLTAVRKLDSFEMREEASLIRWLARLAEHQITAAADFHGARKRDQGRDVSLSGGSTGGAESGTRFFHATDSTQPLARIANEEEQRRVEACVAELADEYRELILLRNYAGASWEAIAEETGRPSAAAARMMHARALVELGKLCREAGLS
ncbi:MAG: sigma-70 family RNA polymerase sigma factor [Planctomycetota bacterium]